MTATLRQQAETAYFKLAQARSYTFHNLPTTKTLILQKGQVLKVNDPRDIAYFRARPDVILECDQVGVSRYDRDPSRISAPHAKTHRSWKPNPQGQAIPHGMQPIPGLINQGSPSIVGTPAPQPQVITPTHPNGGLVNRQRGLPQNAGVPIEIMQDPEVVAAMDRAQARRESMLPGAPATVPVRAPAFALQPGQPVPEEMIARPLDSVGDRHFTPAPFGQMQHHGSHLSPAPMVVMGHGGGESRPIAMPVPGTVPVTASVTQSASLQGLASSGFHGRVPDGAEAKHLLAKAGMLGAEVETPIERASADGSTSQI